MSNKFISTETFPFVSILILLLKGFGNTDVSEICGLFILEVGETFRINQKAETPLY